MKGKNLELSKTQWKKTSMKQELWPRIIDLRASKDEKKREGVGIIFTQTNNRKCYQE